MEAEHDKSALQFTTKLVSGAVAGIVGTTAVYPLDFIKTRRQVQGPSFSLAKLLDVRDGKGLRIGRLYSGLSANLVGVTPEKAIKLAVNDALREQLGRHYNHHPDSLPSALGAIAGAGAAMAQFVVTTPMELVKIKMQMGGGSLMSVVRESGLFGMYRGGVATLSRDIPFSMLLFQSNAMLKELLGGRFSDEEGNVSMVSVLTAGLTAGAMAAYAVTPLDVVKTRVQAGTAPSIPSAFRQVFKESGMRGFFRGGRQRMAVIAPLFGISLAVYEAQQRLFHTHMDK